MRHLGRSIQNIIRRTLIYCLKFCWRLASLLVKPFRYVVDLYDDWDPESLDHLLARMNTDLERQATLQQHMRESASDFLSTVAELADVTRQLLPPTDNRRAELMARWDTVPEVVAFIRETIESDGDPSTRLKEIPHPIWILSGGMLDLRGMDLHGVRFPIGTHANGYNAWCERANLSCANLTNARLSGLTLRGIDLSGADLTDAALARSDLRGCNLKGATFRGSDLSSTDCRFALMERADFGGANLFYADMRYSVAWHTRFNGARFFATDLRDASFDAATMQSARLVNVRFNRRSKFLNVDTRDIDWSSNELLHRHIRDQNYLYQYEHLYPFVYYIWNLTSRCGQSLSLWFLWCFVLITLFSIIIGLYPNWFRFDYNSPLSPFVASAATFTTFGFSKIQAITLNGYIVAVLEIVTGYLMLAGLISIFTNKLARRS